MSTANDAANGAENLAVQLDNIEKRFPGVIANHDVNLRVHPGTIHAIVGENGAGKSTLMKVLYGMHEPEAGTITINGERQVLRSPGDAIAAGIGMVHQHFMLADNFTVLENIILGSEPGHRGVIDFAAARVRLQTIMASLNTDLDLDAPVSDLGVGERQRVEIMKVLFRGARILILDEPTAVLVPEEVDELFATLRHLVNDGATVIFISHKLDEVLQVSDEITVMRQGTTVAQTLPGEIDRSGLAELMVGSELPSPEGRTTTVGDTVRLRVRELSVHNQEGREVVSGANLEVRSREIVGIAGVEGNGQYELCTALMGLQTARGVVEVDGVDLSDAPTRRRHQAGMAYIPFDRQREGLMLNSSLWENTLLGRDDEPRFRQGPLINQAEAKASSREIIERFRVKTPDETTPAFALSGGNQQKLVVGRALVSDPAVLIAAHPTRGIDVGAQAAVWDEIRGARDSGLAVLLISADLEELIGLSDTIAVMFDGKITARLDPDRISPAELGSYMTGAYQGVNS
jgi:ABC-type uncharacterized transport system ATPase subunit